MLFGFALAVVAGYLLGPQPLRLILSLLGCWALARLSFLLWPGSWLALASAATFAGAVAWKVLPRFFGAAKKWRNQSVAPLLAGLAMLSAMAGSGLGVAVERQLLVEALLLFATLMAFMGGRIIAPAMAGYAQSQGRRLDARVQPGLEGAVLILLGLAFVLNPLPWPLLRQLAAALVISAGVLSAIRLLRWQPWRCARGPADPAARLRLAGVRPAAARAGLAAACAVAERNAACAERRRSGQPNLRGDGTYASALPVPRPGCAALDPGHGAADQPGRPRPRRARAAGAATAGLAADRGRLLVPGLSQPGVAALAVPRCARRQPARPA